ncbi:MULTISPECIES: 2-amino-4-hydroxy-6-hydroxymethyldihydropteridine diphosphokinase [Calditerrivibrio]|jgi:2-amino-4-hydroxy-6-hydroxymethyldihydropteridine diphosphokinase|uniref:2-amino-4-hydroxy-6-hydroxymethyldihydropteridine pyrophosphokinase n=1 Tax=Calditerrivibrio nitroreducens TaxID=477976 RepID=A0A2J6WMQ4_9BACT|nr:MAG: 2-amino-4-hydroxy-6-hydroxymethyldihydropteridine diphosphokinase [Calditerrivibrio nitroreducens]
MADVLLGLGSNIPPKSKNLKNAIKLLSQQCLIVTVSNIYSSLSLLKDNQEDYFNIVVMVKTDLSPLFLLKLLKNVEISLGRIDTGRWNSRIIDIDILDYNNQLINMRELIIPHPEMHNRSFVLYPLRDIIPDYKHPLLKKDITTMINELDDDLNIKILGRLHWR